MKIQSPLERTAASVISALRFIILLVFWGLVFGFLLHTALSLKDAFPVLAGLAGLSFISLAAVLAALSLK